MRTRSKVGIVLATVLGGVAAGNCSALAPPPGTPVRWLAHRGVHQTFPPEGIDADTCTAARIHPPSHGLLENTLPSVRAAFDAGADAVEIDLHRTADGQLAVFHDAGLACRTDGEGAPEDHPMDALRRLDVGHGYTADGGATFPLRGTGLGALPELGEVLSASPDRRLVLDLKTNDPALGDAVAERLAELSPERRARLWVYGGPGAVDRVRERLPDVRTFDRRRLRSCAIGYLAVGWTGTVPPACRDTVVLVPVSHAEWLWGWPRRFERRMARAGTEVVLIGPWDGGRHTTGIDDPQTLDLVPADFGGWIWTNRIRETRAPVLR